MAEVIWTIGAKSDLNHIHDFIAEDSPFYAERFISNLIDKTLILKTFPESGGIVPEFNRKDLKELIEGNYRIIYKIESNSKVGIVRVHHSAKTLKDVR